MGKQVSKQVDFDVTVNATIRLPKTTWDELVSEFDGDEDQAKQELSDDLESATLDSMYGEAWVCSAEVGATLS